MILMALRIAWPPASRSMMMCPPFCIANPTIGILSNSFLATNRGSPGNERSRREDIEKALMIRNEHVRLQPRKILHPLISTLIPQTPIIPRPTRA